MYPSSRLVLNERRALHRGGAGGIEAFGGASFDKIVGEALEALLIGEGVEGVDASWVP